MELLLQAATIMTLGMVLVFMFLALVILCVQATARLVQRHEARQATGGSRKADDSASAIAAVIAAAVHEQESGATTKR